MGRVKAKAWLEWLVMLGETALPMLTVFPIMIIGFVLHDLFLALFVRFWVCAYVSVLCRGKIGFVLHN